MSINNIQNRLLANSQIKAYGYHFHAGCRLLMVVMKLHFKHHLIWT